MENFQCWLPSWDCLQQTCKKVAKQIKAEGFRPDVVVALSRGGFVPARTICDMLIIKDLVSIKVDHWGITASKDGKATIRYPLSIDLTGKNVLIVDDITDTGDSMLVSMDFISSLKPKQVRTATAFHIKTSKFKPDYFGEEMDWKWVVFPWNYVEDMCNIIPKVLDKNPKYLKNIKTELKERFKVDISEEDIMEILGELEERNIIASRKTGWTKV